MTEDIFQPFTPTTAPEPAEPVKRNRRQRAAAKPEKPARKPRAAAATNGNGEAPAPRKKPGRKPKADKHVVAGALKLDFSTALSLASEMKREDIEMFGQIAVALRKLPKGSRTRIVAALGKMFA